MKSTQKDFIFNLIEAQKDCEFSIRSFLQKDADGWKNVFSMLKLIKKGTRTQVTYNYDDYIFKEQIIDVHQGLSIILPLLSENRFDLPSKCSFKVNEYGSMEFIASKSQRGWIKGIEYPVRLLTYNVANEQRGTDLNVDLIRKGSPYFPKINDAILHLFELYGEQFSNLGHIYVVLPDYRARIEYLKLMFSKVELSIDSPEIKRDDLLLKVYSKAGVLRKTYEDVEVSSEKIEIDVGFQPDILTVVLFASNDDFKIDEKEFTKWRTEKEGIVIERPEEEIFFLIKEGEGQDLEYKYNIESDKAKNEFIETIVAFSNTNRGLILIGVNDNGTIIGTSIDEDTVNKIIHDSCDPPPNDIHIERKEVNGNTILIVDVPEGENKPYQSKRNKQWYIRHNASDMIMERSELLDILAKQRIGFEVL